MILGKLNAGRTVVLEDPLQPPVLSLALALAGRRKAGLAEIPSRIASRLPATSIVLAFEHLGDPGAGVPCRGWHPHAGNGMGGLVPDLSGSTSGLSCPKNSVAVSLCDSTWLDLDASVGCRLA